MKTVLDSAATLFVMLCIFMQSSLGLAQTDFVVIEPKLQGQKIDLQSLNELNRNSANLTFAQKKDSFKFYMISAPFEVQMSLLGAISSGKPLISGRFDQQLLQAIAQMLIEEMNTIDQLSPFSFATSIINAPKWDVNDVWECLWFQSVTAGAKGNSDSLKTCSVELSKKSGLAQDKSLQLVTSMATVYRTLNFFNALYRQGTTGEGNSQIYTSLWNTADAFYKKYVRTEGLSNFKQTFSNGIIKMGALSPSQKTAYDKALNMLREAAASDQPELVETYRKAFADYRLFFPENLSAQ